MKLGIIIETNDPEKSWNAARFANASLKKGHLVKIFLLGAGVEIQNNKSGRFDSNAQLIDFSHNGGVILACGTCIKSRNQGASDICPISTMNDCVEMIEWSDKAVTF